MVATVAGFDSIAYALSVGSDGTILVAGAGSISSGIHAGAPAIGLAKYNPNGTLDDAFGTEGTVVTVVGTSSDARALLVMPSSGTILVAGQGSNTSGTKMFALAEYNAGTQANITYDNNGDMLTDQNGTTYTYDAWGRMVSATPVSGPAQTYTYNALGERVTITTGSSTDDLYYSNQWQVIQENAPSETTAPTDQYVWGEAYQNELVLRDDNSTSGNLGVSGSGLGRRLYALQDANWDVMALVNTSGTVVERFTYEPYGTVTVLNSSGTATTDAYSWLYMYQDGRFDPVTRLYEFEHRDYSPVLGQWMEQDPAGYRNGANRYLAFAGNPVNNTDATGLCADSGTNSTPAGLTFVRNPFQPDPNVGGVYDLSPSLFQQQMQQSIQTIQQGIGDVGTALQTIESQLSGLVNDFESLTSNAISNLLSSQQNLIFVKDLQVVANVVGFVPIGALIGDIAGSIYGAIFGKAAAPIVEGAGAAVENTFPENEGQIQHIFRDAEGHLPDTSANRALLKGVADDPSTTLGSDQFGNTWSAKTLPDGTQVWTQTRNGQIINGGLNKIPRMFNPQTGLSGS